MKLSYNDVRQLLQTAITAQAGADEYSWVADVYDDAVIWQQGSTGQLWRASYSIDPDTQGITLGVAEQVMEQTQYLPVARMSAVAMGDTPASFDATGGWITREGKVFALGDYPDKAFSLTADEADQAIRAFTPVPLELEHLSTEGRNTILDGKLGQLVGLSRKGDDLWGQVRVPTWLDAPWSEFGRKVSMVWNRATKTPLACGLVLNPRVSDATLFAAAFAGARDSKETRREMQQIHDITVGHGAACATPASMTKEPSRMSKLTETLRSALREAGVSDTALVSMFGEPTAPQPETPPAQVPPTPQGAATPQAQVPAAFADEMRARDARIALLEGNARQQEAETTVRALVQTGQLLPYEVTFATAQLLQALTDDATHPVTFAAGNQQLTRAAGLVAAWAVRPKHGLSGERVPASAIFGALPDAPQDPAMAATEAAATDYITSANKSGSRP